MNRFSSRKFIVSILVILSADVLIGLGSITAQVWASAVGSVVALYVAGNVAQKIGAKESS